MKPKRAMSVGRRSTIFLAILFLSSAPTAAWGDYFETFETPSESWRLIDSDSRAKLAQHERTFRQSHGGQGAEYFSILAGPGTYAYIGQNLESAHIISELSPQLWVKSNRADIQLVARIVLPNSSHPRTGEPISFLIAGTKYSQVGRWEQLTIAGVVGKFESHVRGVRTQFGSQVDSRGAFLDMVALNAYGGPGKTEIWIDDLQINGHIPINPGNNAAAPRTPSVRADARNEPPRPSVADQRNYPTLQGSVLEVAQHPFLPRVLDHNGEAFSTLKAMGINTIRLPAPATAQQQAEAAAMNIWLVAPPQIAGLQDQNSRQGMLAIDMGSNLTARELGAIKYRDTQWTPAGGRALRFGSFQKTTPPSARTLDLRFLETTPLGSEFSLADYFQLFSGERRQRASTTPFWAAIATEPPPALAEQIALMQSAEAGAPNWSDRLVVEYEQIRLQALLAAAAGAKGFVFRSRTPLNGENSVAQLRSAAIELACLDLSLLAPWLEAGEHLGSLDLNHRDIHSAMFQTERSRLVMLVRTSAQQQLVSSAPQGARLTLTIPGVVVDARPYLISEGRIRPLAFQRRGSGLQITLQHFETFAAIVVSQDPLVINHLYRRRRNSLRRRAELHYEIAAIGLAQLEKILENENERLAALPAAKNKLHEARANLRRCETLLDTRDDLNSLQFAHRTSADLAAVRRALWEQEVVSLSSPAASPCCLNFTALPVQWELRKRTKSQSWSSNLLPGGTMENLDNMLRAGWSRPAQGALAGRVELSSERPHAGRYALKLSAPHRAAAGSPPPNQMLSAAVRVQRGFLLHVRGWVRIAHARNNERVGRLVIYDSEAGPDLAVRISAAEQWREFSLYRAVAHEGSARVAFAWSGPGEVWLDDVTISQLRLPVGSVAGASTADQR